MQRITYDVFERMQDGTVIWRVAVDGHDAAILKLKEMAELSPNDFELRHLPTSTLIATINTSKRAISSAELWVLPEKSKKVSA